MTKDTSKTNPGMHTQFALGRFSNEEQKILQRLGREWYLTNSGSELRLATTRYNFFLMKPTQVFSEMFNIDREVIVVLSDYERFEPRTLDAFDIAQKTLSELRVESVCRVLISRDHSVEERIEYILKNDPEQPIVIPFTYSELIAPYDNFFIRNRFRRHFYTRDLFGFLSPLRKDLYFFGRNNLLHELVNRHRSGEHTGLFGLRKSGKTSIIYAIERHLTAHGGRFLSIDCESPSVHKLRWNHLLIKLVEDYKDACSIGRRLDAERRYSETRAADSFAADVLAIYERTGSTPFLLLFDEIERIAPGTGSSSHWRDGDDFVYFWQTLRGFFQRNPDVFTYMLVGTNPTCVEAATIAGHENPLFGSIPGQFVPSFSVEQVREMVRKLGRYMGLRFDEIIYSKLTEDFGGHPFLVRQICSRIHMALGGDRPARVDKPLYEKVKRDFFKVAVDYLEMIVQVLHDWYPDEYAMLSFLAAGDHESFTELARSDSRYTRHLIGYGLLQESRNGFSFNIEAMRDFVGSRNKYKRLNLTTQEKWAEISERRNRIESGLRGLIRITLSANHGKRKAANLVAKSLPENRRDKIESQDIDYLLSADKSPLYLLDLSNIIEREWSSMQNVFDMEKDEARVALRQVNNFGRPDAHAKSITEEQFAQLRLHFQRLENILEAWKL